jgi:hypothetical protein
VRKVEGSLEGAPIQLLRGPELRRFEWLLSSTKNLDSLAIGCEGKMSGNYLTRESM